jgi:hypothetical protein
MPALTAATGLSITYRQQYRKCGSPRCRTCATGAPGHGPYWYAFWTEGGRTHSRYLGKDRPLDVGDAAASSGADGTALSGAVAGDGRAVVTTTPRVRRHAATAVPPLRVRTLGGSAVWRGEEVLPEGRWARGKAGTLFKLLLSTPRHALTAEQAIDHVWPEADPQQGAANLRSTIRFLRGVLDGPAEGSSYLRTSGATLVLDPAPGGVPPADWLDAAAFVRRARPALAGTDRAACRAALALYGGAYLPDDPYEDWAETQRAHLAQAH